MATLTPGTNWNDVVAVEVEPPPPEVLVPDAVRARVEAEPEDDATDLVAAEDAALHPAEARHRRPDRAGRDERDELAAEVRLRDEAVLDLPTVEPCFSARQRRHESQRCDQNQIFHESP